MWRVADALFSLWRTLGLILCAALTITAAWIGFTDNPAGFLGVVIFPMAGYWWWQDQQS